MTCTYIMTWQLVYFYLCARFDSWVPAGDFQISSDSLRTAGGPTDQWESSGSGRPANRKPGFVAAVYVAVENSVTLLIGVRMGGGRMAGQDRSMLGGMKALILVTPATPQS